jgi:prevent-host-death family protein
MVMTTTSLADAKARLSELVASAEATHERTIITKNGKPAAILMSIDDLESIQETMYWLPFLDEIQAARQEPSEPLMSREELLEQIASRGERAGE